LDGKWRTYELVLEPDEHVSLRSKGWRGIRNLQATGTDSLRRRVSIVARLARALA
jgi:hypothetical protein